MNLFGKSIGLAAISIATLVGANFSEAATVALDPIWSGITTKGGINHERNSIYAGISKGYGDIFKLNYVYDLSSLSVSQIKIASISLKLPVSSVMSVRNEVLTIGSYEGGLSRLMTSNFVRPTYQTDRTIYPNLVRTEYGRKTISTTEGHSPRYNSFLKATIRTIDPFGIQFNAAGIADAENSANGIGLGLFAFGGSLSIPVYAWDNRQFNTGPARLEIQYSQVAVVPLPASAPLFLTVLAMLALFGRRRFT